MNPTLHLHYWLPDGLLFNLYSPQAPDVGEIITVLKNDRIGVLDNEFKVVSRRWEYTGTFPTETIVNIYLERA